MRHYVILGVRLLLCLTLGILSTGCAFGDRTISLTYTPGIDLPAKQSGHVAVGKFADAHADKTVIGEVRNGYGIKTARVLIGDQDPGAWVANALAGELERNGLQVTKYTGTTIAGDQVVITGSLTDLYTNMYMQERCNITIKVLVTKAGATVLDKEFTALGAQVAWVANAGEYERVTEAALQNVLKAAIPEILKVIK